MPFAVVVDDNPFVVIDACGMLEDFGFRCLDADCGDEAWEILLEQGHCITLLFSDVEMPGSLNGFALARQASERFPKIEIVLASGNVKPGEDDLPPNTTFIPKPFTASLVREHLQEKLPDGKKPEPLKNPV